MTAETLPEIKKPFPVMSFSVYGVHENFYGQQEMLELFNKREDLLQYLYNSGLITFNEINFFRNYTKEPRKTPPALYFFMFQIELLEKLKKERTKNKPLVKAERNSKPKVSKFDFFTNPESLKSTISPESLSLLTSINETLNNEHQNFINNSLKLIPNLPDKVLKTYQNSELGKDDPNFNKELPKMNSIKANIARLLETYISTEIDSDLNNLENFLKTNINKINELIKKSYQLFNLTYSSHIPIYTDVIDYFDKSNDKNKTILSLGRDGIYFTVSHTATTRTRKANERRGASPHESHKMKYLVFPRNFINEIPYPKVLGLLEENGITEETIQDTIIFDTGFIGSVPEFIFSILGIDPFSEDAQKVKDEGLIRLISAAKHLEHTYQIPLPSFAGPDSSLGIFNDVGTIERSPKPTQKATDISQDEEGYFAIEVAKNPDTVFLYGVLKQILVRHFYIVNSSAGN